MRLLTLSKSLALGIMSENKFSILLLSLSRLFQCERTAVILQKKQNLFSMSDLNTRATVTLQVNGQQAEQTLQHLKNNALQLESAIAKAAAAGNKTDLKRLRKELTDTKRQIREIESSTMQVEHVLSRLDRATPKELSRTLATLNRQLDYMERGSKAWNAHVEKIRQVKAELAAVSNEVRVQEGFWTRFNRTMNDWQTTIMGAAAAVTGLVMAGRAAVNAYAEMDAEMANVRKFTGMNEDEVVALNEHQQTLVGTALQCLIELLSVQSSRLYYLVLLLEHIHNQFGKSRCRHFHSLPLRIKNGSEAHDLRNCHVSLCSDTSHSLCELGKVRSRCRTVLRQLVYHRTYREQGTLGTQTFLIPEDSTQFRKNQGSPISQIIESHVDLVGSADEAKNILL